jgi:predicted amidohydrolase
MRDVIVGFELLQYGNVMRWGRTVPNAESALLPAGESDPPLDHWLDLLTQAQTVDEVVLVVERARSELRAWRRRPDPPPDGESFEDL